MLSLTEQFEQTLSTIAPRIYMPVRGAAISQGITPTHRALDFAAPVGTPVVAPVRGQVTNIQNLARGYGSNVRLSIGEGMELVFAHLGDIVVKVGQWVSGGSQIGAIGMTGATDAPHLHYEQRRAGPDIFRGGWSTTSAVDPWALLRGGEEPDISGMRVGIQPVTMSIDTLFDPRRTSPVSTPTIRSVPSSPIFGKLDSFLSTGATQIEEVEEPKGLAGEAASEVVKVIGAPFYRFTVGSVGIVLIIVGLFMLSSALRQNTVALVKEGVPMAIGAIAGGPVGAAAGAAV